MSASAIADAAVRPTLGTRRTIANFASVAGGEGLLRVANFGVAVLIARAYGSQVFGVYAAALAYATVATQAADNGLQTAAVTTIGIAPEQKDRIAGRLYASKLLLLVPVLAGAMALLTIMRAPALLWVVGGLITLRTVLQAVCQLQWAILKALDRMRPIAAVQAGHFGFLLAGLVTVYAQGLPIQVLLAVLVAGQGFELAAGFAAVRSAGVRPARARLRECLAVVRSATPFGISYTLSTLILRMDVLVLTWIAPAVVVGHFAAAQQALVVMYVGSWLLGSVLLPELARRAGSRDELDVFVAHWTRLLLAVLVPLTLIGVAAGPWAVRALYGEAYAASGRPFAILLLATPFIFLNALYLNRLFLGPASKFVRILIGAAVLGLALDVALALRFSITGLAVGALGREVGIFLALILAGRDGKESA